MFSGEVLLYHKAGQTLASFDSDPPFELGWARQGSVVVRADNWGNTDNTLKVDVYWGMPTRGLLPVQANMTWVSDATNHTVTLAATGGTIAEVVGVIPISQMKSKYMKLVFTLAGTSKTVEVTAWFYGKSA